MPRHIFQDSTFHNKKARLRFLLHSIQEDIENYGVQ